jgi:hypothetical protein
MTLVYFKLKHHNCIKKLCICRFHYYNYYYFCCCLYKISMKIHSKFKLEITEIKLTKKNYKINRLDRRHESDVCATYMYLHTPFKSIRGCLFSSKIKNANKIFMIFDDPLCSIEYIIYAGNSFEVMKNYSSIVVRSAER